MLPEIVVSHLIEIFKAVAAAIDGGGLSDPWDGAEDIKDAYASAMADPDVQAFYGDLVENNPFNEVL